MSRRRIGVALSAGGVLLALVLVAVATISALAPPAGEAERVERIASGLRCPDCQALSVAESRTAAAAAIRDEIAAQVADGRRDAEIRDHFVQRYGEWILLAPRDPLAWWLPALALAAGLVAFGAWMRSVAGRRTAPAAAPVVDAERARRVRDELEALDG